MSTSEEDEIATIYDNPNDAFKEIGTMRYIQSKGETKKKAVGDEKSTRYL